MVSVLVVNDQSLQRLALRMLLTAEPGLTVAGEATDGDGAIRASAELHPDVVLMDGRLSGAAGTETIRRLTHPPPGPPGPPASPPPRRRPSPPGSWC